MATLEIEYPIHWDGGTPDPIDPDVWIVGEVRCELQKNGRFTETTVNKQATEYAEIIKWFKWDPRAKSRADEAWRLRELPSREYEAVT